MSFRVWVQIEDIEETKYENGTLCPRGPMMCWEGKGKTYQTEQEAIEAANALLKK